MIEVMAEKAVTTASTTTAAARHGVGCRHGYADRNDGEGDQKLLKHRLSQHRAHA
ncbi:MAG TPA: hypothetical protein VH206_17960 [Xanthobacteraceae bacterium]|jgi:hypothetical protein|nr:hypothetical protein [Xanthobacteraceae bacterium]